MDFELTDEQKNVIKTFMRFLVNPNERYMIIQGAAGTGKTTMIKAMLKSIQKQYKVLKTLLCEDPKKQDFQILLTATTNKAVAVLRELSRDPTVKTIHSTLGLTLNQNSYTGQEYLRKNQNFGPLQNTVLIMDEASMLDGDTFKFLEEALQKTSKAVLIGDVFQLAPVNQKMSHMQKLMHKVPTATMKTVMRHSGPILEAATAFREVVQTQVFQDILLSDKVLLVDGPTFKDEVEKAFKDNLFSTNSAKVLAWSNNRVMEYNAHLRRIKGLSTSFQEGELVITNNPIIAKGQIIPVDSEVEITWLGGDVTQYGVPGRQAEINTNIMLFLPDNPMDAKKLMQAIAKKANSKAMKDSPWERKELWTQYFNIKNTWLDLRSPYASTVHKAQGSSYDQVFIDLYDIGRCNIPSDVARMLYVAISRARERVIMFGDLPAKYRSPTTA